MKEYVDARQEAKQQREAQVPRRRTNNNAELNGELSWERVQDEFLGRVQLDLMQREVSREAILRKMQRECSFAPSISSKAKRVRGSEPSSQLSWCSGCVLVTSADRVLISWTWARSMIACGEISRTGRLARSRY